MSNMPNLLTLIRILLIPILVALIVESKLYLALLLFLLTAITDVFDGFLARKYKKVSSFGTIFDPIADKILTSSVLISLVYVKLCDPFSVMLLIGRDETITGLRATAALKGKLISASNGGKLKTFLLTVSIILFLLGYKTIGEISIVLSVVISIYTGFDYFYRFLRVENA